MHLLRMGLMVLAVSLVMFGLAVTAIAAEVTWTGNGVNDDWSDPENWSSDPFLPQAADDVFHLIGGVIEMDLGLPDNAIEIASFTVDGGNGGGLEIGINKGLKVAGNFVNQNLAVGQEYALTVKESGFLRVDLDLLRVAGILEASGVAGPTAVSIKGRITTIANSAKLRFETLHCISPQYLIS